MTKRSEETKGRASPMAHVRGLRLAAKVACVAGLSAAALGAGRAAAAEPRTAAEPRAASASPPASRIEDLFAVKGEGKWDPCGVPSWGPPAPPELAAADRAEVAS